MTIDAQPTENKLIELVDSASEEWKSNINWKVELKKKLPMNVTPVKMEDWKSDWQRHLDF